MKKLLKSLFILGIVGLVGFGVTQAFFSDEETSVGNTFQAGEIDLKIDHTKQTYNDIDCNTCSVILISDPTNMVVEKDGVAIVTPYPAVFLSFIHPAWTAQNDPDLVAAGARWIWENDPVRPEDTTVDTTYTFRKTFNWLGPITGSDLLMAVGHDNTVEVFLNGILIGSSADIYGYRIENMLHIPAVNITGNIVQGENVLDIKLRNRLEPDGTPENNPAGLIYKFEINGQCQDNFFKTNCKLWELKDLEAGDYIWNFDDVKPGDRGVNVISYHIYDNEAYMCTFLTKEDLENVMLEPESPPDTLAPDVGELSKYIEVFVWKDANGDGNYDAGESQLANDTLANLNYFPIAEPLNPITPSTTNYLGIAWCFGDLTASQDNPFVCTGIGNQNDAQSDILNETIKFYVEQARNNPEFKCSNFVTPTVTPSG